MGQALYRKYRSKNFSEVVGQEYITDTLQKAIKSGRLSHAYLFSGPKGVGKTTVARILAHEVNELSYKDDVIHLDIIEIDAASNRRIDEIRDLREKVHLAPTSAKYKIYIIDEVHMLTGEAFNALLKTLEEPPEHCIFILATTEAYKLPETIVSRTQHFNFRPIAPLAAAKQLGAISRNEKINIEPQALELLAEYGEGSFRDSISLLDQLSASGNKITSQTISEFLGLPRAESITSILSSIEKADAKSIIHELSDLKTHGANPQAICKELSANLRSLLISANSTSHWQVKLLKALLEVPSSPQPYDLLEITLLEAAASVDAPPQIHSDMASEGLPAANKNNTSVAQAAVLPTTPSKQNTPKAVFSLEEWPLIVAKIKVQAASIYTALRLAVPSLQDGKLVLIFKFALHQKKLSKSENLKLIEDTIKEVSGQKIIVECAVAETDEIIEGQQDSGLGTQLEVENIQNISNIFGSAEVLES